VGEEREGDTLSGLSQDGCGPDSGLGQMLSPWSFTLFLFLFDFLFCFLNYFVYFAKMHQITSNQLLNFSIIQHIVLSQ
jgi:hypothetical protein